MYKITFTVAVIIISVNTALALPGSGTPRAPWRIESLAHFNEFAADANYWDDYTRLETDVNLAGLTYSTAVIAPDANNSNWDFDGTAFTGVFDGNGHKITALTIDDGGAGNDYLGLFGCIYRGGEVRNLGLEGGSVSGDRWVGGLAGGNGRDCTITNSYSTGSVTDGDTLGGLVGWNRGTITNSYSTGPVTAGVNSNWLGGLVGENRGTISNSYSTGSVTAGDYSDELGGLVGINLFKGTITSSYSTGSVTGGDNSHDLGGLVGENGRDCTITNSYSTGPVAGGYWSADLGGLVGVNREGIITSSYSTGSITGGDADNSWFLGGLVGTNDQGIIRSSYSTGQVTGADSSRHLGGLVGWSYYGTITNSYSTGSVTGGIDCLYLGGLVGYSWGTITNSYSTGSVTAGVDSILLGGLVGANASGTITNSFWDTQTSGMVTSDGGTGKTTAEMQTKSTFTSAGWDFVGGTGNGTEDIWTIHDTVDYPRLVWEMVNFVGWYEVDFLDFAFFANYWMDSNCGGANDCDGADLDFSDKVDWADLKIFCDHWLEGAGQ